MVQQELNKRERLQATSDNLERTLRDENERLRRDNKDMRSEIMVRGHAVRNHGETTGLVCESDLPKSRDSANLF